MIIKIDNCGECNVSGSDLFGDPKCWHPKAHGKVSNARVIEDTTVVVPWCPLREMEVKEEPCPS